MSNDNSPRIFFLSPDMIDSLITICEGNKEDNENSFTNDKLALNVFYKALKSDVTAPVCCFDDEKEDMEKYVQAFLAIVAIFLKKK